MLVPVRNIEVLIVTRYGADDLMSLPAVQTYLQGAQEVRSEIALSGELNHTSWEQAGEAPEWAELRVRQFPSILFIDQDTSKEITRLEGSQVTAPAVSGVLREINRLQRDAAGNYFDADGNWLADTDSGAIFTAPWGAGLFSINLSPIAWIFGGLLLLLALKR